jgi:DNA-binding transcriptional LysR family regulator
MESLAGLLAFTRTAETLSFVEAARRLGISPSAVGKNVTRLEQHLNVQLLHRSTRRLSLTAEGALFFERCRRILDDLQDAEAMLSEAMAKPRGRLRISLPTIGYRFLVPLLPEFARLYPDVDLDLDFNDRLIDVVAEGVDAVIRSGVLPDSQLMSRRLGSFRFVLCASPDYIELYGAPRHPDDLMRHRCLQFRFPTTGKIQDWKFREQPAETASRHPAALVCNNMEALRAAAIAGLGIAYMPEFLAGDALKDGELQSVLGDKLDEGGDFWLLWPTGRQLSPKLRVFIDFLTGRLFKR